MDLTQDVQTLLDRIPNDFDHPDKRPFLELILFDASVREACTVLGIPLDRPRLWADVDQEFSLWLGQVRSLARRGLQREVIQGNFFRTMFRFMKLDEEILNQVDNDGIHSLTDTQMAYLNKIRSMYGIESMANLLKTLAPDEDTRRPVAEYGNLNIYIGEDMVRDEVSRQAAARQVLGLFQRRPSIEGEFKVIDG